MQITYHRLSNTREGLLHDEVKTYVPRPQRHFLSWKCWAPRATQLQGTHSYTASSEKAAGTEEEGQVVGRGRRYLLGKVVRVEISRRPIVAMGGFTSSWCAHAGCMHCEFGAPPLLRCSVHLSLARIARMFPLSQSPQGSLVGCRTAEAVAHHTIKYCALEDRGADSSGDACRGWRRSRREAGRGRERDCENDLGGCGGNKDERRSGGRRYEGSSREADDWRQMLPVARDP